MSITTEGDYNGTVNSHSTGALKLQLLSASFRCDRHPARRVRGGPLAPATQVNVILVLRGARRGMLGKRTITTLPGRAEATILANSNAKRCSPSSHILANVAGPLAPVTLVNALSDIARTWTSDAGGSRDVRTLHDPTDAALRTRRTRRCFLSSRNLATSHRRTEPVPCQTSQARCRR